MGRPELGTFSKVPIDFSYSIVKDQPDAHKAKGIPSPMGQTCASVSKFSFFKGAFFAVTTFQTRNKNYFHIFQNSKIVLNE
jgi:hypothetical protein